MKGCIAATLGSLFLFLSGRPGSRPWHAIEALPVRCTVAPRAPLSCQQGVHAVQRPGGEALRQRLAEAPDLAEAAAGAAGERLRGRQAGAHAGGSAAPGLQRQGVLLPHCRLGHPLHPFDSADGGALLMSLGLQKAAAISCESRFTVMAMCAWQMAITSWRSACQASHHSADLHEAHNHVLNESLNISCAG